MSHHAGRTCEELERMRAYVEGALSEAEAKSFRQRIDDDAELAAMTEAYAVLVEATPDVTPAPRTVFADLGLEAPAPAPTSALGSGVWKRVGVAAALLLALGLAFSFQRRGPPRPIPVDTLPVETVALGAIALDAGDPLPLPPPLPSRLTDYRPFGENGLNWLRDLDEGTDLAAFLGWPIVLFVDHPTCPICKAYEKGPFRNPAVGAAAARFVLVRRSWDETPREYLGDPSQGWPLFHLLDAHGTRLTGFRGWHDDEGLLREFERLGKRADREGTFAGLDLEALGESARALAVARGETEPGRRYRALVSIDANDPGTRIGEHARYELARIGEEARLELERVRAIPDAAGAREALRAAAATYRGSPYGEDFEAVGEAFSRTGRFPILEQSR